MNYLTRKPKTIGVITPAGPGGLGDQAMLDVATTEFVERTKGQALVFPSGPKLRSDVNIIQGAGKIGTLVTTARAILGSSHVAMIGADILDGTYSANASLKRLRTLRVAHRLGRKVRVFGSSYSKTPHPEVSAFLRNATWLEVLARDPVSQTRMQEAFGRDVPLVADLAFLLKPEATTGMARDAISWIQARRSEGTTVLGVNVSGHIVRKRSDQSIAPFVGVVTRWLEADKRRACILLPHDFRAGHNGDLQAHKELGQILGEKYGDRLFQVTGSVNAWDMKAIAGEIDLAFVGRMHLAIACLGMGTPPLCVVSNNKFEGLMQHFGLTGLMISPEDIEKENLVDSQLGATTARAGALRVEINAALPRVRELSGANFEGYC